jgi:hypothetical protein
MRGILSSSSLYRATSEYGRRLLAVATPLHESPLLNRCFVIPFACVLVPQLVFMAVGDKRKKSNNTAISVGDSSDEEFRLFDSDSSDEEYVE